MKINEITEVRSGPSGTGSSPGSEVARASEYQRAQLEVRELKKFSTEFANEFLKQFNLIGQTSVDVAYQKAATQRDFGISAADASALGKADFGSDEYKDRMNKFQSAMPKEYINSKRTYDPYQKKTRGGQLGNKNAYRGGPDKDVKTGPVGTVVRAIGSAGKDLKKDFKTGQAFGKSLAGMLSDPVGKSKMAASKKNPGKQL
tara:strand:- start:428 stop:1033 length:606 start_codon:yes stop_codon:yes gene_type:complete